MNSKKRIAFFVVVAAAFLIQILRGFGVFSGAEAGVEQGGALQSPVAFVGSAVMVACVVALILYVGNYLLSKGKQ